MVTYIFCFFYDEVVVALFFISKDDRVRACSLSIN